jgi:hypothetical protein
MAELTLDRRRPLSEKTCLYGATMLTWREDCLTSHFDPGCVKTLFKSKFAANLPDFKKLQFAKALISLKLKF